MLLNQKIVEVRAMTDEEMDHEGWDEEQAAPLVLVLDNGAKVYPSRDPEGNGPGVLFGIQPDGQAVHVGTEGKVKP